MDGGKIMNVRKILYYLPFALLILLSVLQVLFSSRIATKGKITQEVEAEIIRLEKENQDLKSAIARQGGLNELALQAEKKGFVQNPSVINYSSKIPVALFSQ